MAGVTDDVAIFVVQRFSGSRGQIGGRGGCGGICDGIALQFSAVFSFAMVPCF